MTNETQNEEYIAFLKNEKGLNDETVQMALNYATSKWEHSETPLGFAEVYEEWEEFRSETDRFYNSPEHEAGVELGKSLGDYEAFLSAKKAYSMGEIELWLAFHEPKSLEEWEEWEKVHGPNLGERWER